MTLIGLGSLLCIPLLATSVGAAVVQAVPEPPGCLVDDRSGLPMPQGARGICAGSPREPLVFVQRSDEGLLIVWPTAAPPSGAASDGERTIAMREASSRVVFCPSSLLDFRTGAPGDACLRSSSPPVPGPGALTGAGTVRANLIVDASGRTRCPSAARVTASVTNTAGVPFELTGSIVALESPDGPDSCESVYDRIELGVGGSASSTAAVAPAAPGNDADRAKRLMQLDDGQWRVVDMLLALTPQDWAALEAVIPNGPHVDSTIQPAGLIDIINAILDRVNAVRATLSSVSDRIPDRADVRALVGQIDLSGLRDVLSQVGETLSGLIDIARDLREGFDTFDVVAFRARLDGVLGDLQTATQLTQRLLCVYDPGVTIREISTAPLQRLVDHTPAIILYGLSRILDAVDPQWDQRLRAVLDAVPPELDNLCNTGVRSLDSVDSESVICSILRPKAVGASLGVVRAGVSVALLIVRFAKNHTKEEIQATVGAEVVAGATAGTSVKNPLHTALELWTERLDNFKEAMKDFMDLRHDCLDADKDVERDLKDCAKDGCSCSVPLSVLLKGNVEPSYRYVSHLLEVRLDQSEAGGLANVAQARDKYNLAVDANHDGTAAGYALLCEAYQLLLPSTGITQNPQIPKGRPRSKP